jgi:RNA polymerase sigma-70 factor (ECF subfamily)
VRTPPARHPGATPPDDEQDLVARAQGRDAAAFRLLLERHQARAHAFALRVLRSPSDAEEVTQDAFVRAWLALPGFRGESSFSTWLYRIVAHKAFDRLDQLRRRRARELQPETLPETAVDAVAPEPRDALLGRRLVRLVEGLSGPQREAVVRFYFEDGSVEAVAGAMGLNENTVKTHLARARAALRDQLAREDA